MPVQRYKIDKGATVWRRYGCSTWAIDFCRFGIRERRSLHTTNKEHAFQIARKLATEFLARRWNTTLNQPVTLEEAVAEFAKEYESLHHAESTRLYAACVFGRFRAFMRRRRPECRRLDEITYDDLESYQRERATTVSSRGRLPTAVTVNRDLRELSTMMGWWVKRGALRANPCLQIKCLKHRGSLGPLRSCKTGCQECTVTMRIQSLRRLRCSPQNFSGR